MLNLGGNVLGFSSADSSSAAKGESVADTIRMISCYADICAMRHPKEGAAYVAAQKAAIPVIKMCIRDSGMPLREIFWDSSLPHLLEIWSLRYRSLAFTELALPWGKQ